MYSNLNKFSERRGVTFTMFSEGVEVHLFSVQDGNDFFKRKNHTELMYFYNCIYLFLSALGRHFCMNFSLFAGRKVYSLVAMRGLFIAVAFLMEAA